MRPSLTGRRAGCADGSESGAVAVLVAVLAAVVLFVVGAFAVDLGHGYVQRRLAQNSADSGALAGAGDLPDMGGSLATARATAQRFVEDNFDTPSGGWAAAWAACADPGHLAVVVAPGQCISFSAYGTRVRVRVPPQALATVLAAADGISTITIDASAVAQLEYAFSAGVLPFGLPGAWQGGYGEVCLKTGPDGQAPANPPCQGSTFGNFGTLDFTTFGNATMGTATVCTGDTQGRLTRNIILGVDHPLDAYDDPDAVPPETSDTVRYDRDMCLAGADPGSRPNGDAGQTGVGSNLDDGLVAGTTLNSRSLAGRLANTPYVTVQVRRGQPSLDDRGLWTFIDPTLGFGTTVPASCDPGTIQSAPASTRKALMAACLTDYAAGVGCPSGSCSAPLFTVDANGDSVPDIQLDPRFAYVPELWEPSFGTGSSSSYEFRRFRPVYLQTLYFGCNANSCAYVFDPGQGAPANAANRNDRTSALTALLIPPSALPASTSAVAPGRTGTPTITLLQ